MFVVLLFGDGGLIIVSHTRKISPGTIHRKKGRRKRTKLENMKMKKKMWKKMKTQKMLSILIDLK